MQSCICFVGHRWWNSQQHVVDAVQPLQGELAVAVSRQYEEMVRELRRILPAGELVRVVVVLPVGGEHVVAVRDGDQLVVGAEVCAALEMILKGGRDGDLGEALQKQGWDECKTQV